MKKIIFLMMLFVLTVVATKDVSAQSVCSKKSDGKQVYVEIANMTNNTFTINLVDENCKEIASIESVPAMEIFSRILTNGQAFCIREDGSGKILRQSLVNPSKPILFVETEMDGSNFRVRELDVVGDNEFKKRADAAFAALGNKPADKPVGKICSKKLSGKPITIKWLNKTNESLQVRMVGTDCQEAGEKDGEYVWRDKTFETTAYPGYVYHIYKIIESDEGGYEDFQTITVTDSNGIMTLEAQNNSNQNTVSNAQGNTGTTNSNLEEFKKHLIGTWKSKIGEGVRYDQNTLTSFDRRGNEGVTVPDYR